MKLAEFNELLKHSKFEKLNKLVDRAPQIVTKIKLEDATVFFKPKEEGTYTNLMQVFVSKLLKKAGIPVAKCELGFLHGVEGNFSYSVEKPNTRLSSYDAYIKGCIQNYVNYLPFIEKTSVPYLKDALKQKVSRGELKKQDASNIVKKFVERMIINNILANYDDHADNHKFLLENNSITLADMFDLDKSLLGHTEIKTIEAHIKKGTLKNFVKDGLKQVRTYASIDGNIESTQDSMLNLQKTKKQFPKKVLEVLNKIENVDKEQIFNEMNLHDNSSFKTFAKEVLCSRLEMIKNDIIKNQTEGKEL